MNFSELTDKAPAGPLASLTMTEQPQGMPARIGPIEIPSEWSVGAHADLATIWHTPESFVIDFLALKTPPQPVEDERGNPVAQLECVVSARVRMAPTHVFNLMQALNTELSKWEASTGRPPHAEPRGDEIQ